MTAQFMTWWRERSLREQRMLLVMTALLAITIIWLGIYRPIQAGLSNSRERHQEAVVRLGEVRAQAEALRGAGTARLPLPLATLVTQSAAEAGFANATVAPQGDRRVSLSISAARPGAVLPWLASLESRGVVIERLVARANADPTLTIDATLSSGGG